MFEESILAREHAKQWQVGVVPDGEDVSARALGFRELFPRRRVPRGQFAI